MAPSGGQANCTNCAANSNVAYDPSYTSATVYSADSIGNIHTASGLNAAELGMIVPAMADAIIPVDRRPSNYYLFEDDSTHEFDDEGFDLIKISAKK